MGMTEQSERLYDAAVMAAQGVWADDSASMHDKLNQLTLLQEQVTLMINAITDAMARQNSP